MDGKNWITARVLLYTRRNIFVRCFCNSKEKTKTNKKVSIENYSLTLSRFNTFNT